LRIPVSERRLGQLGTLTAIIVLGLIAAACTSSSEVDNATGDTGGPNLIGFVDGELGFPHEVVTSQGNEAASLYLPVFLIAVVIFVLVEGILILAALRFRRKATDTDLPAQTHGNNRLEIVWTAVPALVVFGLFVASTVVLTRVNATSEDPGVVVDVQAFRFGWKFDYPESGVSIAGGGREGAPEMVLPVDEPVRFRLTSVDVIHSFYVPAFYYKKDVIPGRINEFEVTIEEPGVYGGQCAEFCGLAHSDMYFSVRAVEGPEFEAWLAEQAAGPGPAEGEPAPAEGAPATAEGNPAAEHAEAGEAPPGEAPPGEARPGGSPLAGEPAPAGSVPGETTGPAEAPAPAATTVLEIATTAEEPIAFTTSSLEARAGETITVVYTNDSNVPHNIAFYDGPDATGEKLAMSETIEGPGGRAEVTFVVPATPGDYLFRCEIHPMQMIGALTVVP
jgi:cytochrome c oxidase subunit 2